METRRSFLKKVGASALGATLINDPFIRAMANLSRTSVEEVVRGFSASYDIIRSEDLLYLRYYFTNLEINWCGTKLVKIDDKSDSFILVRIPQQHIAEEVQKSKYKVEDCKFDFTDTKEISKSFISGFSFLSFRLKKTQSSVKFEESSLNDWNQFDLLTLQDLKTGSKGLPISLSVKSTQYPMGVKNFPPNLAAAQIGEIIIPVTLIEAPYKMFLSPVGYPPDNPEGKAHRYNFLKDNSLNLYYQHKKENICYKLAEVWNNRLVLQTTIKDTGITNSPPSFKIAAFEENSDENSPDNEICLLPNPNKEGNSAEGQQRSKLAALTNKPGAGRDLASKYFSISPLGLSAFLEYENPQHEGHFIVGYKHELNFGRDNNVTITSRAIDARSTLRLLVSEVSERIIENGKSFLIKRKYFNYIEKEKTFTKDAKFNSFPFRELIAKGSGSYYKEQKVIKGVIPLHECSQEVLKMPYSAIDYAGRAHDIEMDLLIIPEEVLNYPAEVKATLKAYDNDYAATGKTGHKIIFNKKKLCYAPDPDDEKISPASRVKNTELLTEEMQLYSVRNEDVSDMADYPLLPRLKYAKVYIPQLEGIETISKPRLVNYAESFFYNKFSGENKGRIFLQTLQDNFDTTFKIEDVDDKAILSSIKAKGVKAISNIFTENYRNIGGLINPDIVIENISIMEQGISLSEDICKRANDIKNIRPEDILRGLNTEIIGGINLKQILKSVIPIGDSPIFQIIEEAGEGIADKTEYNNLKEDINRLPDEIRNLENRLKESFNSDLKSYIQKYIEIYLRHKMLSLNIDVKLSVTGTEKPYIDFLKQTETDFIAAIRAIKTSVTEVENYDDKTGRFIKAVRAEIIIVMSLRQLLDEVQERINRKIRQMKREAASASDYIEAESALVSMTDDLNELTALKDAINSAISVNNLLSTPLDKIIKEYKSAFMKFNSDLNTFELNYPSIFNAITIEYLKVGINEHFPEFFSERKQLDTELDKSLLDHTFTIMGRKGNVYKVKISDKLKELKIIKEDSGKLIFSVYDNLKVLLDSLEEKADDLKSASDKYYKIQIDAFNELIGVSMSSIENEKGKAGAELEILNRKISSSLRSQLESFRKDMFSKHAAYINVKEIYYFYQAAYLKYVNILERAMTIKSRLENSMTEGKEKLNGFIERCTEAEKIVHRKLKEKLEAELKAAGFKLEGQARKVVDNLAGRIAGADLKNTEGYFAGFKEMEQIISSKTAELYNKIDGERQNILSQIEKKKAILTEKQNQLKNFLTLKKEELQNQLDSLNQELISSYSADTETVKDIRSKIRDLEVTLSKLTAANKREINYSWRTDKFEDVNLGFIRFLKGRQSRTELSVDIRNSFNYSVDTFPPRLNSVVSRTNTRLSDFSINFINCLTVEFESLSFTGGSNLKDNYDISIRDVRFEGPLNFVQVLQRFLKTLDKGLRLDISALGATLGYEVSLPDITGGAFNFAKAKLILDMRLPFKSGVPMQITFGLNNPQDMFLVTAGIFGGRGCFQLVIEPRRGVVAILLIIEFGAVLYINIGIADGIAYIFAGIYLKKEYDRIEIRGYLTCGGALNILGIVTLSVTFYLGLTGTGKYLEGFCTVSYKIKVCAFLKISGSMTMYKRIHGSTDNSSAPGALSTSALNYISGITEPGTSNAPEPDDEESDLEENEIRLTNSELDQYFEAYYS